MKHFVKKEELETKEHVQFYDITESIRLIIKKSKVETGHILIQPLHTTVGIYVNEGEVRLLQDFIIYLSNRVQRIKGKYLHDDIAKRDCPENEPENAHSHIKAALYSNPSVSLVLFKGELQLGKYQRILLAEFDGPCPRKNKDKRKYIVSIIGK